MLPSKEFIISSKLSHHWITFLQITKLHLDRDIFSSRIHLSSSWFLFSFDEVVEKSVIRSFWSFWLKTKQNLRKKHAKVSKEIEWSKNFDKWISKINSSSLWLARGQLGLENFFDWSETTFRGGAPAPWQLHIPTYLATFKYISLVLTWVPLETLVHSLMKMKTVLIKLIAQLFTIWLMLSNVPQCHHK